MDGAPYLRKVDLKTYSTYQELSSALEKMFSCFTIGQCGSHGAPGKEKISESKLRDILNGSEYVLTYEDKEVVKEYFNNSGFQRWKKIYGDTDDVNRVQRDIRLGHSKTVENVMNMLKDERSLQGVTICDTGCGIGSLAIPLAKEGAVFLASDISAAMVAEAQNQAREQLQAANENVTPVTPKFEVKDLESLDGKFDTVICLDVLIHYPQSKADGMIAHLASLAEKLLILSFAPKTLYYDLLKRVGELFPGPSKATRAYLHSEADVKRALKKVGWSIRKRGLITTQFYFATLVEAVPA